ncbi:MIF4G domain-containing protein [Colletotrichum higginsianum]|nr:MIF4G domain-containing protein [Colletotrichum higginsianum]
MASADVGSPRLERRERDGDLEGDRDAGDRPHHRDSERPRNRDSDRDRDRNRDRDRTDSYRPARKEQRRPTPPVKTEEEKQAIAKAEYEKLLSMRSGGTYIPPARLRALQSQITDKSSKEYQRLMWEALKKSINGLINKVNYSNIKHIVPELFGENLIKGRGLFCRSIMKAQAASLPFTPVFAAMAAIVNTKLPAVGELLVKRLIISFRKGFKRSDKAVCVSSTTFLAHLINHQVAHERLAGQMLLLLLHKPTDDSVEIAVNFMREVGQHLQDMQPAIALAVWDQLRNVLHEADIDKRVQYMIEVLFQVRKDSFKDNPPIKEELDLVEEEDQITHMVDLDGEIDLLRVNLPAGQEPELPSMIVEICSQEKTFSKFHGLIGERFAKLNRLWTGLFEESFADYYSKIHRYETNRLRNIARFFAHLLASDAIGWHVLSVIHLNEDETTSSSRIFIKILFQDIAEELGMAKLQARMKDDILQPSFEGLFPRDNARNIRFSINYFTSIGMGALTEASREYLQNMPKPALPAPPAADSDSDSVSSYSSYTGSSYSRSRSRSRTPRRAIDRKHSESRSPSPRGRGRSYSRGRSSTRSRSYSRSVTPPKRGVRRDDSYSASPPRRRGRSRDAAAASKDRPEKQPVHQQVSVPAKRAFRLLLGQPPARPRLGPRSQPQTRPSPRSPAEQFVGEQCAAETRPLRQSLAEPQKPLACAAGPHRPQRLTVAAAAEGRGCPPRRLGVEVAEPSSREEAAQEGLARRSGQRLEESRRCEKEEAQRLCIPFAEPAAVQEGAEVKEGRW